jgi:hypothetical protein
MAIAAGVLCGMAVQAVQILLLHRALFLKSMPVRALLIGLKLLIWLAALVCAVRCGVAPAIAFALGAGVLGICWGGMQFGKGGGRDA